MADAAWTAWEQQAITTIFGVTLDAHRQASSSATTSPPALVYVADLAEELQAEQPAQHPPQATLAMADRVLISRLQMEEATEKSWDYIVHAWTRCRQEELRVAREPAAPWIASAQAALAHVKELLISYAGMVLEMPDMFPCDTKDDEELGPAALVPTLLQLSVAVDDDDRVAPWSAHAWASVPPSMASTFVREFVDRFCVDDSMDSFDVTLGGALQAMTQRVLYPDGPKGADAMEVDDDVQSVLAQMLGIPNPRRSATRTPGMDLTQLDWRPIQQAWVALMQLKTLAKHIPFMPSFTPACSASEWERESLLGPLLRLSCFPDAFPAMARDSFADPRTRSPMDLDNTMQSLRMSWRVSQTSHFQIFNAMIRADATSREQILAHWGTICERNVKRGAMQVRSKEVATDAYMVNVYDVLLRFAEPFAEPTCAKMDRIDPTYLRVQRRWDTSSFTRILATEADARAWQSEAEQPTTPFNFITDVFFLTQRMTSLALGKAMRRVEQREKELERQKKRFEDMENERARWQAMPHASQVEQLLQRGQAHMDKIHSEILAAQTIIMEREFLQRVMSFISFSMVWLIRMAAGPHSNYPQTALTLPLPPEVPRAFQMLPEHIFEDACDTVLYYSRHRPDVFDTPTRESMAVFCTTFLSSGTYIRNPFLKAKLAEMLSYNVMPFGSLTMGVLGDTINSHPLVIAHLVPALMAFWIDAESTGSHTQFYDKFNIRYHLAQVFKAIWDNVDHKQQLHKQATEHQSDFVVFINRLMNDVTFLLDDALDKLAELHTKQAEMDEEERWHERTPQEREEFEGIVRGIQSQIRSDLGLGHEFLRLLIMFTKETSASFMSPEIVDRLAAMLDYNLDVLVGPRCQELKVKDPKRVGFDPKSLLKEILSVFLNLASHQAFVEAIARDGRSYRRETFSKAASIAQRHMLLSPADIDTLADLVDRVEQAKQAEADEEEDLGEVPDEFLDPLLATLMRDPVRLPSSRAVVDRSTIKAHLLSDNTDPFNRMPLKLDDVVPDDELRERIQAWVAERRASKA
ncbi:Ubiquitin conjugation factor E4 [Malassezia pachydermatis]